MSFLTPVWSYVDALVHPAAQQDALTAARHRAFIAPRLLGSLAALASFPVYVAIRGVPTALEVGVFAWLAAPILIVYDLSRTGRYERAHLLSALALTALAALVALCTGGMLGGCANSDFGEVNQTLVTNGIHDWIGRGAPPPKAEPSKFEYTDDERALRDNAYPLIEPPYDRQQWYSVAGEYGMAAADLRLPPGGGGQGSRLVAPAGVG